jgi:nitroreductase
MISRALIRRLVELASQAPSVHNTQPWLWRAFGDEIELSADGSRQLLVEDPAGRDLVISCGAALDHFQYAAHALGWDTHVTRPPRGTLDGPVARVRLVRGRPSDTPAEDLDVLRTRCTDRRRFTSWPMSSPVVEGLVDTARSRGALARAVVDEPARLRLELLAHQAQEHRLLEAVTVGAGAVQETRALVEAGDGVIVLGGAVDDPTSWLRTGEALSALWLDATRAGLSVVPMSLPVEVDSVREELRDVVLDSRLRPHLLVRIGWQAIGRSQLPRTPRRPVSDVFRA